MCISPSHVWIQRGPEWEQMPVPCKQCWRCKKNRVDGYVGRAMAEANTSSVCCTLTLTYAPRSDLADKILHPRHFQLFIKMLRRSGHKVRYLVAGEYGDLKGRAHFHAILFFTHLEPLGERGVVPRYKDDYPEGITQDDAPFCREIPQERMVHIREWPHGHIKADWSASQKSIRYVCKYILADDKNTAWFSLSKKPAIGAEWFARKAEKAKELGVLPSSFNYLPPGADRQRPYYMTGATRRDYLNAITQDPADRSKMNEWIRNTFDKHDLQRRIAEKEALPHSEQFEAIESLFRDQEERRDIRRKSAEVFWAEYQEWLFEKLGAETYNQFQALGLTKKWILFHGSEIKKDDELYTGRLWAIVAYREYKEYRIRNDPNFQSSRYLAG